MRISHPSLSHEFGDSLDELLLVNTPAASLRLPLSLVSASSFHNGRSVLPELDALARRPSV